MRDLNDAPSDEPANEPFTHIWSVYLSKAEKYDKALVERWRSNMSSLLIFAGLFSAILTAFLVESYPLVDQALDQNLLLSLYALQHPNGPFNASILNNLPALLDIPPDNVPTAAVVCNALWFIALGLSLASALFASLVDQWAREFLQRTARELQRTDMLPSPVKRARIFAFLYLGLRRFQMHAFVGAIPLLLHMSLLLFLGGLVAFLWLVSHLLAIITALLLFAFLAAYLTMTLLPLFLLDCPYETPLSDMLWTARRHLFRALGKNSDWAEMPSMVDAKIANATVFSADREERDKRALAWATKGLPDDDELEPFIEAIPQAIWEPGFGRRRKYDDLLLGLIADPHVQLATRIEHLLESCNSDLLQPAVRARRQLVCLKAIWSLGAMAEMGERDPVEHFMTTKTRRFWHRRGDTVQLIDAERPEDLTPPTTNPWDASRRPTAQQPLSYFQELGSVISSSNMGAQYITSVTALVQWNDLCAINGRVEELGELLNQPTALVDDLSKYSAARIISEDLVAARRKYIWGHAIQVLLDGGPSLDALAKGPRPIDVSEWIVQVRKIIQQMSLSWSKIQYRILHSYLRASAEANELPYQFDATCRIIRPMHMVLDAFDDDLVGSVLTTFIDNVSKATQLKRAEITHVDTILSILLPWFDWRKDLELPIAQRLVDALIEFINNREHDETIVHVLSDCDITLLWARITDRLETVRSADGLGRVSRAMWKLAMLFPGLSTQETRLEDPPHFNLLTLSVLPVAPFAVSVITLLKSHILNAFDRQYGMILSNLDSLQYQLTFNAHPGSASGLESAIRRAKEGWDLVAAMHDVLRPLPLKGLHLENMPKQPVYNFRPLERHKRWWNKTTASVDHMITLAGKLQRRIHQARFAIVVEFLQYCAVDAADLPFKAVESFSKNIMRGLDLEVLAEALHVDSQRSFVEALHALVLVGSDSRTGEHKELVREVLESSLFAHAPGRDDDPKLLWLDDLATARALQDVFRQHLPFFNACGPAFLRRVEVIVAWLESRVTTLEIGNFELMPALMAIDQSRRLSEAHLETRSWSSDSDAEDCMDCDSAFDDDGVVEFF